MSELFSQCLLPTNQPTKRPHRGEGGQATAPSQQTRNTTHIYEHSAIKVGGRQEQQQQQQPHYSHFKY